MRRSSLFLGIVGCALVAAATALAGTILNEKTTVFAHEEFSMCTGDLVTLQGTMHVVAREGTSGDRDHFGFDVHFTGMKGFGFPSGARYVETDVTNTQANITPGRQEEFTVARTMNLTRLGEDETFGDGDDLRVHLVAHMTIPANGSGLPSVNRMESRDECR